MQDRPVQSSNALSKLVLSDEATKAVRARASEIAYRMLRDLNNRQEKVTEEQLRAVATSSGTDTISFLPATYGPPEQSMPIWIEVFTRIWREGNAVVSPLEDDAIADAHQQKRLDLATPESLPRQSPDLQFVAKAAALRYLLAIEIVGTDVERIKELEEKLEENQRVPYETYVATYFRAYRDYAIQPPKPPRIKLFGIF